MKKFLTASIVLFALGFYTVAYSQTVGNTSLMSGSSGGWSFGLEYGRVKRDMTFDRANFSQVTTPPDPDDGSEPIVFGPGEGKSEEGFESERIFLKATKQITPRINFFVKLGQADADLDYKETFDDADSGDPPMIITQKVQFDGDFGLAYGLGVEGEMGTWGGWTILGDVQYLVYEVDGDVSIDGKDVVAMLAEGIADANATCPSCNFTGTFHAEVEIMEYRLALYAARTIGIWTPYGGLKYSNLMLEFDRKVSISSTVVGFEGKGHFEFKADDNVGVLIGTDVEISPRLTANLEFRFIDETSTSLGVTWQF